MDRRKIGLCLAGLLLALLAECFCAGYSAGRGCGGQVFSAEEYELRDFQVDGNRWTVIGGSPSIFFHDAADWGHLELTFAEPLTEDITLECYYSPEGDDTFDRFRRSEKYMMKGSSRALIMLPAGGWKNICVAIHGDFVLESLCAARAVPVSSLTPGMVAGQMHLLRFLAFWMGFCAGVEAFAGFWREHRKNRAVSSAADGRGTGAIPVAKGGHGGRPRTVYLDAVRLFAAVLVIVVHVVEPLMMLFPLGSKYRIMATAVYLLALTCNPMFVMISGALLLPYREETLGTFLRRRMWKILLPLLVYAVFYVRLACVSQMGTLQWLSGYVNMVISNQMIKGLHLWMVYALLGLYFLVVPFRYMLKAMPESMEKYMAVLILAFLALRSASYYRGQTFGISLFVDDWPGIFLLGYFLTRPWMRRYDAWLVLAGAAAFPAALWIGATRVDFRDITCNQSIFMVLMAAAVITVLQRGELFLKPFAGLLAAGSRYSYSILLVHWFVLSNVVYHGFFTSHMPNLVQVAGPIFLCLVLSVLTAVVIDHTAVAAVEAALQLCLRAGKKAVGA